MMKAVLAVLVTGVVFVPTAGAAPPFARDSFWNTPLPADAPLDARSADYVGDLQRQLAQVPGYINTTRYSTPVYTVPADQPTVQVKLDSVYAEPDLRAAWQEVPIPANAVPAVGTDGHIVVHQPSTDRMWEFWRATKEADGWHADWGGKMTSVSNNPGFFTRPSNWGATGTSLPLLGGLIRLDELEAGRIDHALALAIPEIKKDLYSWPAQRSDGKLIGPNAIPEGTRFRIDPSVNLDAMQMAPIVRMVAEAAQDYGIVLRDIAGSVTFFGEDPTPTGTNPYGGPNGWFQGKSPATLMEKFPWQHLQALDTKLRTKAPGSAYVTDGGELNVSTAWNERATLRIEQSDSGVTVSDVNPIDAVGENCTHVDALSVRCTGVSSVDAAGSHKTDTLRMLAPLPATLAGGATGDTLFAGPAGGRLEGDAGNDTLVAGPGVDRFKGGDGPDYADYGSRSAPLELSIDGQANDGEAGEGDNIDDDVESLIGGSGDDVITGSPVGNALWGMGGRDVINGRDGADWLNGGDGFDTADYSARTKPLSLSLDGTTNDGEEGEGDALSGDFERLVGGWASDTLVGNAGEEWIHGGDGNDAINGKGGADVLRGDDGTDSIESFDLVGDDVDCGEGKRDYLLGDLIDQILKRDCERRFLF